MNPYESFATEVLAGDLHLTVWPDTVRTLEIHEVTDEDGAIIGHDATATIWPGDVYKFAWRESFPYWSRVREIAPNPTETTPTPQPCTDPAPTPEAVAQDIAAIIAAGTTPDGWGIEILEHIEEYLLTHHDIELPDADAEAVTTLDVVRNIENGNRAQAAEQITTHPEPARMAVAVLATLAQDAEQHHEHSATAWHDATRTVVRTLNAI